MRTKDIRRRCGYKLENVALKDLPGSVFYDGKWYAERALVERFLDVRGIATRNDDEMPNILGRYYCKACMTSVGIVDNDLACSPENHAKYYELIEKLSEYVDDQAVVHEPRERPDLIRQEGR